MVKDLRLYPPEDLHERLKTAAANAGMDLNQYALMLLSGSIDDQSKLIKKLVEKYATFDVKKTAELELHQYRLKGIVDHYKNECNRLMAQIDNDRLTLETINLIMRYSDLLEMIRTYLTSIPEDKELVQQIFDEIKTLNDRCDEISLAQKIRLKKQLKDVSQ